MRQGRPTIMVQASHYPRAYLKQSLRYLAQQAPAT